MFYCKLLNLDKLFEITNFKGALKNNELWLKAKDSNLELLKTKNLICITFVLN